MSHPMSLAGSELPSDAYLALNRLFPRKLETALLRGQMPDLDALVGWEFRGMNTPVWARAFGIKKFVKGFYRPSGNRGEVYGYNCPVVADSLHKPWRTKPSDDQPKRFGFYRVFPTDPTSRDNAYLHAVLLDYSQGQNGLDPSNGLRDYLVQVDPANPDLYLGKAYFALGEARIPVSYFVLERFRQAPGELFP